MVRIIQRRTQRAPGNYRVRRILKLAPKKRRRRRNVRSKRIKNIKRKC